MVNVVVSSDSSEPTIPLRNALLSVGVTRVTFVCPGDSLPEHFDALVLAGGADVSPARYCARTCFSNVTSAPARDAQDFALYHRSEQLGAAVLGICRGSQVMNVARGGTLWQDLPRQRKGGVAHQLTPADGFAPDHGAHAVHAPPRRVGGGGELEMFFRSRGSFIVNSRHHQAVRRLAQRLVPIATAPDGVVEAFERPGARFWCGVQWHPEDLLDDPTHRGIFDLFARNVSRVAGRRQASRSFVGWKRAA